LYFQLHYLSEETWFLASGIFCGGRLPIAIFWLFWNVPRHLPPQKNITSMTTAFAQLDRMQQDSQQASPPPGKDDKHIDTINIYAKPSEKLPIMHHR